MSMNKARWLASGLTLLLCVIAVVLMTVLTLKRAERGACEWPPVDSSELLFEGEYVMRGDIPEPDFDQEQSAVSESPDVAATPLSVSEQPSPMKEKVKPEPEKNGPAKEELERLEKEKRENEARQQISNRVKFGGTGSGTGKSGKSGSPDGNASHGALSGAPGTSLKGRTLESWARPAARATGTIVISVRVNRQGRVIRSSYRGGTGAVAADKGARTSCEQAALKSQFSVSLDGPAEQIGTITYRFD